MAHAFNKVSFTNHAADRMQQRFGVRMKAGVNVDISETFRAVGSAYLHNKTGNLVQVFIPRDLSVRMVLEVDCDSQRVITVMAEGAVVDAVYRKIAH
jgi:hypothetical protein